MKTRVDPSRVESPSYVIDTGALQRNLDILARIKADTPLTILLAQKAFAAHSVYPQIAKVLDGVCASGLFEAQLGKRFGKQIHTYAPAYRPGEIDQLCQLSDHVVFNSPSQVARFSSTINHYKQDVSFGLRVNPECSLVKTALYDPCAPKSRLGSLASQITPDLLAHIDGLHLHALCEDDSFKFEKVMVAFETGFGHYLPNVKWVNFGGGHDLTRDHYDVSHFCQTINGFANRHPHLQLFIEPGGAVAANSGVLVAEVLDIVHNDMDIAILDISCTAHTPDILEMPYRAHVTGEVPITQAKYIYRLGGCSCLAGDIFGDYGFDRPLKAGDRVVFTDMAHYTMVKTTMFNGVGHPNIVIFEPETDHYQTVRRFTFDDFANRLS